MKRGIYTVLILALLIFLSINVSAYEIKECGGDSYMIYETSTTQQVKKQVGSIGEYSSITGSGWWVSTPDFITHWGNSFCLAGSFHYSPSPTVLYKSPPGELRYYPTNPIISFDPFQRYDLNLDTLSICGNDLYALTGYPGSGYLMKMTPERTTFKMLSNVASRVYVYSKDMSTFRCCLDSDAEWLDRYSNYFHADSNSVEDYGVPSATIGCNLFSPYQPSCNDGILNQDETGIDCGGSCPACPPIETCEDGFQNQGETGVDCGGPCINACETCEDGILNQDETGIDCGGSCTNACPEIYWQNLNGEEISNASIGDTVKLVLTNADFGDFEIYESDSITPDDRLDITVIGENESSNWVAYWTITLYDYNLAKASEFASEPEFIFKIGDKESDSLSISEDGANDPINISIDSPLCGSNYSINANLDIAVSVFDSDDIISGNVTVDGSWVANLHNGENEIEYTLETAGNIQLVASAENERGDKTKVVSNIMVISTGSTNNYTAACIDEPKNFYKFASSLVRFKADSSAAITCNAGDCQRLEHNSSRLRYLWEFSTCVGDICDTLNKTGTDTFQKSGNNMHAYDFLYHYTYPGSNWAELAIEII